MNVIVLRGIPGSGKSHYARTLPNKVVVSADHYFESGGTYRFDPAKIGEAHNDCLRRFSAVLNYAKQDQPGTLIVDNTNASIAEMAPYMAVATAYGIAAEIVEVACDVVTAAARNIHGVPSATVQTIHNTMKANDPLIPPWWKRTFV